MGSFLHPWPCLTAKAVLCGSPGGDILFCDLSPRFLLHRGTSGLGPRRKCQGHHHSGLQTHMENRDRGPSKSLGLQVHCSQTATLGQESHLSIPWPVVIRGASWFGLCGASGKCSRKQRGRWKAGEATGPTAWKRLSPALSYFRTLPWGPQARDLGGGAFVCANDPSPHVLRNPRLLQGC